MSSDLEIIKVLQTDLLPFGPLSYEHRANGWKAQRVKIETPTGSAIVCLIQWDESVTQVLRVVSPLELPAPFPIRFVTKQEVGAHLIVLPDDIWNLANFNTTHLRTDGICYYTFLPSMERFAQYVANTYPAIRRFQICASRETKQIVILPFVTWNLTP